MTTELTKSDIDALKSFSSSAIPMYNHLSSQLQAHSRILDSLVSKSVECPRLLWFYPKKPSLRSFLSDPFQRLFQDSIMLVPVCPVTLRMIECGVEGVGWEVKTPKKWVEKWGPALLVTLKLLQAAVIAGRVLGVPLPSLPSANDIGLSSVSLLPSMNNFSKELASRTIGAMWGAINQQFTLDNVIGGTVDTLQTSSEGDLPDINTIKQRIPQHICDDAYLSILHFLTQGENAKFGSMEFQLKGKMNREIGQDGSVEWVSVEGREEWHKSHRQSSDTSSVVIPNIITQAYNIPISQQISTSVSISKKDDLDEWLRDKLTSLNVKDESTISKILNGFKAEFITTVTEFSEVTEDTFTDKYLENSVGIAQVGLRIKLLDIHKTLRESTKESRSQNQATLITSSSVQQSEIDQLRDELKLLKSLPLQFEQLKHLPEKFNKLAEKIGTPDDDSEVSGGGSGGLVQIQKQKQQSKQQTGHRKATVEGQSDVNIHILSDQVDMLTHEVRALKETLDIKSESPNDGSNIEICTASDSSDCMCSKCKKIELMGDRKPTK
jgi:hypothetical protein